MLGRTAGDPAEGDAITTTASTSPLLSAALGIGLCRLQRTQRLRPKSEPRFLVLHASPDAPSQHLAIMNCAFAAQKLGIMMDTVVLAQQDSMLLQQAAHLTGGLYLKPDGPTQSALAQYLITCCLADRKTRQHLCAPAQQPPETRALCFLTKQPVEVGYACSVCLAVFSRDDLGGKCPVCSTRFELAVLPGQLAKKRLRRATPAAGGAAAGVEAGGGGGGGGPQTARPRQASAGPAGASAQKTQC
jgi:transcription initiation factor TFIIH subunit 3